MKKVLPILTAFIFTLIVACGSASKDKEAQQKASDDSTANALLQQASKAASDTVKPVAPADTTKK